MLLRNRVNLFLERRDLYKKWFCYWIVRIFEPDSATDLQNEHSYLSGGYFPKSPSDAQVSDPKYETGNKYELLRESFSERKNIPLMVIKQGIYRVINDLRWLFQGCFGNFTFEIGPLGPWLAITKTRPVDLARLVSGLWPWPITIITTIYIILSLIIMSCYGDSWLKLIVRY